MTDAARGGARLVIAGTSSGVGKTTTTVALARALAARGLRVAVVQVRPRLPRSDLPRARRGRALPQPRRLDDGPRRGARHVRRASRGADVALIEGVMGLFDGASPDRRGGLDRGDREVARRAGGPGRATRRAWRAASPRSRTGSRRSTPRFAWPASYRNRVGSRGHLDLLRRACTRAARARWVARASGARVPRAPPRAAHRRRARARRTRSSTRWGEPRPSLLGVDAHARARRARAAAPPSAPTTPANRQEVRARGVPHRHRVRRGVPLLLRRQPRAPRAARRELVRFSPLARPALPDVDGLYLGGGYPEEFAREARPANAAMRAAVKAFARRGRADLRRVRRPHVPRAAHLARATASAHPMVGLLPAERGHAREARRRSATSRSRRRRHDPRPRGLRFRGHQFRYSELRSHPDFDEVNPSTACESVAVGSRAAKVFRSAMFSPRTCTRIGHRTPPRPRGSSRRAPRELSRNDGPCHAPHGRAFTAPRP